MLIAVVASCALIVACVAFYRTLLPAPPTGPIVPPCVHDWSIRLKTIVEPLEEFRGRGERMFKEMARLSKGSTHAVMTCSKCGAVREMKLPGIPE